jgi:DUF971 family protein
MNAAAPGGAAPPTPVEIRKQGGERLRITWNDGHVSEHEARALRGGCRCAHCVDENSGRRRVGEAQVDAAVQIAAVRAVGMYAVQITFSDGHGSGIYSFDLLRDLCGCESCRAGRRA